MKYLIIAAALCLSACSNFEFTSNIAPSNFKEYFKPSAVTEVDSETLDSVKNRNLGLVEGYHVRLQNVMKLQLKLLQELMPESRLQTWGPMLSSLVNAFI